MAWITVTSRSQSSGCSYLAELSKTWEHAERYHKAANAGNTRDIKPDCRTHDLRPALASLGDGLLYTCDRLVHMCINIESSPAAVPSAAASNADTSAVTQRLRRWRALQANYPVNA